MAADPSTPGCLPWPAIYPCVSCLQDAEDPGKLLAATTVAESVLFALSGRVFGLCPVAYRPCRLDLIDRIGPAYGYAWTWGQWSVNRLVPSCGDHVRRSCACSTSKSIILPAATSSVDAVWLDGAQMAEDDWRFDGRRLWRLDGRLWPTCQAIEADDHGQGAFTVEAVAGRPVPPSGQWALGEMACELSIAGTDECKLPQRVQTITRQGVTVGFLDPQEFLNQGKTGLYWCDVFIAAENPGRLAVPSTVWSPDLPAYHR